MTLLIQLHDIILKSVFLNLLQKIITIISMCFYHVSVIDIIVQACFSLLDILNQTNYVLLFNSRLYVHLPGSEWAFFLGFWTESRAKNGK